MPESLLPVSQSNRRIDVRVACGFEDLAKVIAIRAVVYMGEQKCPYAEEFDGNDFAGTQFVAHVDDEPAATMRIRYFSDFIKIERLAVLPMFRRTGVTDSLLQFVWDFARSKGFQLLIGQAQVRLTGFWSRRGLVEVGDEFHFSDHKYVAMAIELDAPETTLGKNSDQMVLNRPEGAWHQPGVLDQSAAREPTNPASLEIEPNVDPQ